MLLLIYHRQCWHIIPVLCFLHIFSLLAYIQYNAYTYSHATFCILAHHATLPTAYSPQAYRLDCYCILAHLAICNYILAMGRSAIASGHMAICYCILAHLAICYCILAHLAICYCILAHLAICYCILAMGRSA
jgi:hypothetical protein